MNVILFNISFDITISEETITICVISWADYYRDEWVSIFRPRQLFKDYGIFAVEDFSIFAKINSKFATPTNT